MRPKQNPQLRREEFIAAATQLYAERGYAGVSVRDVLDAVGDKSSSPSVFYYYFKSKEELYRCVVESIAHAYVVSLDDGFADNDLSLEERTNLLLKGMMQGLKQAGNLIAGAGTVPNRLFMLDMREEVTRAIAYKWTCFLVSSGLADATDAEPLALFIAGGISELLFSLLEKGSPSEEEIRATAQRVAMFSLKMLGISSNRSINQGVNPID